MRPSCSAFAAARPSSVKRGSRRLPWREGGSGAGNRPWGAATKAPAFPPSAKSLCTCQRDMVKERHNKQYSLSNIKRWMPT
jgi:hypothetical protein